MKLDILIARFPYAGNGGTQAETPEIGDWLVDAVIEMKNDPRVGRVSRWREADTPITMTRNRAAEEAQRNKSDVVIMIDSDMAPDHELHLGDPSAKPFWKTSFDFLYQRRQRGLLTVIGAPYCGPPPHECVYVFKWANQQSDHPNIDFKLEMFSREEAAARGGIEEVAALPTGFILFDMAALELVMPEPFYYEYEGDGPRCELCHEPKPGPRSRKASTEDVTATRDIALVCQDTHGYSPLFVNWDAWAGHWKPKCVRKPRPATVTEIGAKYREAVVRNHRGDRKMVMIGEGDPENNQDWLRQAFELQRANGSS